MSAANGSQAKMRNFFSALRRVFRFVVFVFVTFSNEIIIKNVRESERGHRAQIKLNLLSEMCDFFCFFFFFCSTVIVYTVFCVF